MSLIEGGKERSLEEQLASVIEDGDILYAGDGVKILARPTTVTVARPRRRRQARRSNERARMYAERRTETPVIEAPIEAPEPPEEEIVLAAEAPEPVPISVSVPEEEVALAIAEEAAARNTLEEMVATESRRPAPCALHPRPIAIRFAEHARSPFVVSLRDIILGENLPSVEESVPQERIVGHDLIANEVPDIGIFEMLASDLFIDEVDVRYAEQFTPSMFSRSYAAAYGPFTKFFNRVGWFLDRIFWRRTPVCRPDCRQAGTGGQGAGRKKNILRPLSAPAPSSPVPVRRTVVVMGALALVATLPANAIRLARSLEEKRVSVSTASAQALGDIESAASSNLLTSIESLRRASETFRSADESLARTNALALALAHIVPQAGSSYASARALLEVGAKTADAGRLLAKGLDAALAGSGGILDRLAMLSAYADSALPLLDDASRALANVEDAAVPEAERAKVGAVRDGIETGRLAVREFVGSAELIARLMGRDASRRFLVVFQNADELRPTGGFMGSYAELDLDRGEIKRLVIPPGGTYDLQGQLIAQIVPPDPLRLVADRWEFQDSNWSPDFPTAAAKMRALWSASGGYSIDGVIAVNATVFADMLKVTGPIDVPELGKTLTAENAIVEIEKSAELEYDREENQPKKILSLAGPRLIERLKALSSEELLRALAVISDALVRKEIQIALTDPEEDALAQGFDWSGRLKPTSGDALSVITANIAGGKTDAVVQEAISHEVVIADDGGITDTVSLVRTHGGVKHVPLTGVRSVAYIRFYVPRGSALAAAEGFATAPRALLQDPREDAVPDEDEIIKGIRRADASGVIDQWDEGDRTVFGGWIMVDPGESATLSLRYRLPFSALDIRSRLVPASGAEATSRAAYTALFTSQSGTANRTLVSSVRAPSSWSAIWSRPLNTSGALSWDRDFVTSSLFERTMP